MNMQRDLLKIFCNYTNYITVCIESVIISRVVFVAEASLLICPEMVKIIYQICASYSLCYGNYKCMNIWILLCDYEVWAC